MATLGVIKELLEAGVHFGHPKRRWNPKMGPYIYSVRNGIYIIDLEKTAQLLLKACEYARDIVAKGGYILFVGTKRQVQDMIEEEAKRCGMYFINNRWLGGTLTNFETVRKSIARLKDIQRLKDEGKYELITKKEQAGLDKESKKLLRNLGGIIDMDRLPEAVYVIDPNMEEIVVREANKLKIPVLAIVDTNCDPSTIDYPIPGNDDAIKSTKLITSYIANAVIEGRRFYVDRVDAAKAKKEEERVAREKFKEEILVDEDDLPELKKEIVTDKKVAKKKKGKKEEL